MGDLHIASRNWSDRRDGDRFQDSSEIVSDLVKERATTHLRCERLGPLLAVHVASRSTRAAWRAWVFSFAMGDGFHYSCGHFGRVGLARSKGSVRWNEISPG